MREAEYWQRVRQDGMKSRKNQSNSAYDVVSLEYNKDEQGEMQKYHDDMSKILSIDTNDRATSDALIS